MKRKPTSGSCRVSQQKGGKGKRARLLQKKGDRCPYPCYGEIEKNHNREIGAGAKNFVYSVSRGMPALIGVRKRGM